MPIYFYWGEDDFARERAVKELQKSILDPDWFQFNYDRLSGEKADTTMVALDLAMTPVFGVGARLVEVVDSSICQHCGQDLFSVLERTLPKLPATTHLLFTSRKKPDKRLKSTKLLQDLAQMQEFALIPPWKGELLLARVSEVAQELEVSLTPGATELLAEAVGNDTRQLWNELTKLSLYGANRNQPLDEKAISVLVSAQSANSIKLATAILAGDGSTALGLAADLINRNEPALKIVATLVGQFRTWGIVKLMMEEGERDNKAIATAAEIGNPNRIYYLRKSLQSLSSSQLLEALPILLELEFSLKGGAQTQETLFPHIIRLCQLFDPQNSWNK